MKLISPYKTPYHLSQGFSKNYNPYYNQGGLLGHTGWDMVSRHLTPIYASVDSYCYSYMHKDNPDLMRYRSVYTLVEDQGIWYEISYGHLMDIYATPKTYIKAGDPIGTQGNTGNVFVGGVPPIPEQKKQGAGSHLHFQVRIVRPVDKITSGRQYLWDDKGLLKYMDKFWEVTYYKNGFNGCVDPAPFFEEKEMVLETLRYGDRGEQVKVLQRKLNLVPDGVFGIKTHAGVCAFQRIHGLVMDGIVGPITREKLNET